MKIAIFTFLKCIGIFKISKFLFRKNALILAYHGFELNDESAFNDKLFIKKQTLEKRIDYLKKKHFNIVSLDDALDCNLKRSLPSNSIVITIDDGWYSTIALADKIFTANSFPYTVYVTSYYAQKETPVLNVLLGYLMWTLDCNNKTIDTRFLHKLGIKESSNRDLKNSLFAYFESLKENEDRTKFVKELSDLLGINYDKFETCRYLSLLNHSEIKTLAEKGVDIQLHTHRHFIPFDNINLFKNEILENRNSLMKYVKKDMKHFCYPSGIYIKNCEKVLKTVGVTSATTCEPGFVSYQSNYYFLPRFLDGENISQIEFEAEVTGVAEIFRTFKKKLLKLFNQSID